MDRSGRRYVHWSDSLVLGTVNAPFAVRISASELARILATGAIAERLSHVTTFFTEVNPENVLRFGLEHGVDIRDLVRTYQAVNRMTGERSIELERRFDLLAPAA